jgi:hypothetical protein
MKEAKCCAKDCKYLLTIKIGIVLIYTGSENYHKVMTIFLSDCKSFMTPYDMDVNMEICNIYMTVMGEKYCAF